MPNLAELDKLRFDRKGVWAPISLWAVIILTFGGLAWKQGKADIIESISEQVVTKDRFALYTLYLHYKNPTIKVPDPENPKLDQP